MTAPWTIADKLCLVTGGTSGIGKATALGLARCGAHVIIVGRDRQRGAAAIAEITQRTGNRNVDLLLADLQSQASIRQLADRISDRYPHLHVLINNAGAIFNRRGETVDGIEQTWALNHLAYFLLTNLLLGRMTASAPARIVNVSSEGHRFGRIDFNDLQSRNGYRPFRVYGNSKLANVLFTYELARRLRGSNVSVNCLHPGGIASNFGHNNRGVSGMIFRLLRPFLKSPDQGAETSIYLAASPELASVSGRYFADCKQARSSAESYDNAVAERLWQVSAEMTGLAA
jgi:NAD(P)-dependent dehydrogenase (short-subunit alcohol dehydrogenase family)